MTGRPGRTALYRLFNANNRLLYLGIARHPEHRWKEHEMTQRWWHLVERKEVEWHPSREIALEVETLATTSEKPLYDRASRASNGSAELYDNSQEIEHIAVDLRQKIMQGVHPVGAMFVTRDVARQYGVAPVTAKSAFHRLALAHNLVEYIPHGWFRVTTSGRASA